MYNGIINVYKEKGFTSHDVVAKLRGILGQKKVGHTGTLDPDATGVLPVCLGSGTKLCDMLTDKSKEYEAVMLLGVCTDTEDVSGQIIRQCGVDVTPSQISGIINSFVGEYDQIPPMYSAIKINGKRLYELARAGLTVEHAPRRIKIESVEITEINFPRVKFRVKCGKGTYIRSLCRDIGMKAGCGACMESLVRTRVGSFMLEDSFTLEQIRGFEKKGGLDGIITPADACFCELPEIVVSGRNAALVKNGNTFPADCEPESCGADCEPKSFGGHCEPESCGADKKPQFRVYTVSENGGKLFAGIYGFDRDKLAYRPVKMFLNGE